MLGPRERGRERGSTDCVAQGETDFSRQGPLCGFASRAPWSGRVHASLVWLCTCCGLWRGSLLVLGSAVHML
jgi:hypothetical protein